MCRGIPGAQLRQTVAMQRDLRCRAGAASSQPLLLLLSSVEANKLGLQNLHETPQKGFTAALGGAVAYF